MNNEKEEQIITGMYDVFSQMHGEGWETNPELNDRFDEAIAVAKSNSGLQGNKTYRHKSNPEERKFHNKFVKRFSYNSDDMDHIAFGCSEGFGNRPSDHLSDRERTIMISTVQWLGSPVGQSFLRGCGYIKEQKKKK